MAILLPRICTRTTFFNHLIGMGILGVVIALSTSIFLILLVTVELLLQSGDPIGDIQRLLIRKEIL